jgi:hypothetical protein
MAAYLVGFISYTRNYCTSLLQDQANKALKFEGTDKYIHNNFLKNFSNAKSIISNRLHTNRKTNSVIKLNIKIA